jgi:hypothetical protein
MAVSYVAGALLIASVRDRSPGPDDPVPAR